MSYNTNRAHSQPLSTAGKITILTSVSSLFIFLAVFLLNLGQAEFQTAQAQNTATTSVTVQNTPPEFDLGGEPREQVASASTSPTNSGDTVTFIATATDQNGAPYFLLICDSANATAQAGDGNGIAAPTCDDGQIAVSTSTVSGTQASAATTTTEAMPEQNDWWAFACDDDADNPECSPASQGITGTATSSPFVVNHRPTFDNISPAPAADPGNTLTFTATSTDSDTFGGQDTVRLFVCVDGVFDAATPECTNGTIASSSLVVPGGGAPVASTNTASILPDGPRNAHVFLVDEHNHPAVGGQQSVDVGYTINNVAPTINASLISLNSGNNMSVSTPAATTSGFTIDYEVTDANSCLQLDGSSPEIVDYQVSVYHTGAAGTTTCIAAGDYNPNFCYPSASVPTDWDLDCQATTTVSTCGGTNDDTETWSCTFSLWYVADPTDVGVAPAESPFAANDWRAAVAAVDDDNATTTVFTQSSTPDVEVEQNLAFALDTAEIPYGSLAPGEDSVSVGSSSITTDVRPTGNVGIDLDLSGLIMCPDSLFAVGACPASATSSIAVTNQFYQTGPFTVSTSTGTALTGTASQLELDVPKATTTAALSQPVRPAYWAIQIPETITFAGAYTGRNTFTAVTAETADWTP